MARINCRTAEERSRRMSEASPDSAPPPQPATATSTENETTKATRRVIGRRIYPLRVGWRVVQLLLGGATEPKLPLPLSMRGGDARSYLSRVRRIRARC